VDWSETHLADEDARRTRPDANGSRGRRRPTSRLNDQKRPGEASRRATMSNYRGGRRTPPPSQHRTTMRSKAKEIWTRVARSGPGRSPSAEDKQRDAGLLCPGKRSARTSANAASRRCQYLTERLKRAPATPGRAGREKPSLLHPVHWAIVRQENCGEPAGRD